MTFMICSKKFLLKKGHKPLNHLFAWGTFSQSTLKQQSNQITIYKFLLQDPYPSGSTNPKPWYPEFRPRQIRYLHWKIQITESRPQKSINIHWKTTMFSSLVELMNWALLGQEWHWCLNQDNFNVFSMGQDFK